jgi:hypothetical protein
MVSFLTALDSPEPWSLTPHRRPAKAALKCACLGGTYRCDQQYFTCGACGAEFNVCRASTRHDLRGSVIHPGCAASGDECTDCGLRESHCHCERQCLTGYHGHRDTERTEAPRRVVVNEDPLIGFEFETIFPEANTVAAKKLDRELHVIAPLILAMETDSSLGENGIEVVTVPLPLSIWRDVLPEVLARIAQAGGDCEDARCGGHIHVTRTNEMMLGAQLVYPSYLQQSQLPVWTALARRSTTAYSSIAPIRISGSLGVPGDRAALWAAPRTLEWRHPSGCNDPRVVMGRAELLVDTLRHGFEQRIAHERGNSAAAVYPPWGFGRYVKDRPEPTPDTRYAWALLRSIGL